MKTLKDYEYFKTENGVLYCGDNIEILNLLKDKHEKIDLCLTSPPYNLGNNHHTGNKKTQAYDDNLPEEEYQKKQIHLLNLVYSVSAENASMIYNHKNRIKKGKTITPYEWIFKTKWNIKQELVWFNGSQNFDKCRFYPMTERIYILNKNTDMFYNEINAHDFFKYNAEGSNKEHTRSFPLEMALDLIKCYKNGLTIDCFMGSGTTALACEKLNRKWIGIEISEKYCEIAKKRIEEYTKQLKLFK